jgi:endonuclease/exonuclease/phosphatase family metal-dependent hydrolase
MLLTGLGLVKSSPGSLRPHPLFAEPETMSVVSLNMAKQVNVLTVFQNISAAPRLRQADLFLLQEVAGETGKRSIADELAGRLGYHVAFSAAPTGSDRGLAVVSRFPISDVSIKPLKTYNLRFRSRDRFFMALTMRTPSGDLRVWNTHLDTRLNTEQRLEQLLPVIDDAAACKGPRLIGGDLNTNDLYWLGSVVPLPRRGPSHSYAIRQAMEQRGFQTPFSSFTVTFPQFHRQLDWMYVNGLQPVSWSVEPVPFSDHHAIWASLRMKN